MANEKAAPMTRADIAGAIAARCDLTREQAAAAAREYEAAILRAVSSGQDVRLNGFGSFKVQERPARTGRNPATGQAQDFPAKSIPKFVPSKVMKDALLGIAAAATTAAATTKDSKAAKPDAATKKDGAAKGKAATGKPGRKLSQSEQRGG